MKHSTIEEKRIKKELKKKILIPVDGSDRALSTVRYIARNDQFLKMDIVLLHVFSSGPDGYWDMETDPRITQHGTRTVGH